MSAGGALSVAVRGALARLAFGAPARAFPIVGADAPAAVDDLRLSDDIALLDSPRSANVLLVAGSLPAALHEPAARVHDQMSHPRGVVWWTGAAQGDTLPFPDALRVGPADDVPATLCRLQGELVSGRRASSPNVLPDVDPAPWRGVGPYGQGGTGMTGGAPYGRPLADRVEDRDGLMLDHLPVRVGPFFPPFPPGLVLDVLLQGDLVQQATVAANPFADVAMAPRDDPFRLALARPVPVAMIERARARHHLRWLAHALRVHGLGALGRRALGLVAALARDTPASRVAADVAALARLLERTRALGWATGGVGLTPRARVEGRGLGPVARAAGVTEDERVDEPAYRALGFSPVVARDTVGDARARWRQRLAEVAQSLDLAARAGDREAWGDGVVESPHGRRSASAAPPSATFLSLLPELLGDREWGDAVTTVVSLDLDLVDAASAPTAGALPAPGVAA